jgi:hypothetical protein
MRNHNSLLEPFEPEILEKIRTAFQAAWHELCNAGASSDPHALRNRLAGTIARLAKCGISDPLELKDQALRTLTSQSRLN